MSNRIITRKDVEYLDNIKGDHLISVYMPVHADYNLHKDSRLKFGHLINTTKEILDEYSVEKSEIKKVARELSQLFKSTDEHRQDGALAIFIGGGISRLYFLPHAVDTRISCRGSFNLAPIEIQLNNEQEYYILNLNLGGSTLQKMSGNQLEKVPVNGIEDALHVALRTDEIVPSVQAHPIGSGSQGFHGQGGNKDKRKMFIEKYFRFVDKQVSAVVDRGKPIVVDGVMYLQPIYRRVSKHRNFIAKPGV